MCIKELSPVEIARRIEAGDAFDVEYTRDYKLRVAYKWLSVALLTAFLS